MITRLEVKTFRGVAHGEVDGLSPLSVLVGPNNCGKSTCLEAVGIVSRGRNPGRLVRLLLRRGGPAHHAIRVALVGEDHKAVVSVVREGAGTYTTTLRFGSVREREEVAHEEAHGLDHGMARFDVTLRLDAETGPGGHSTAHTHVDVEGKIGSDIVDQGTWETWPFSFVHVGGVARLGALEDAYSEIEKVRRVEATVDALSPSMPGLTDLKILRQSGEFMLHTMHGEESPRPAYVAGDGLKRFLQIAAALHRAEGGVVLLEEPECFQHSRYLEELTVLLYGAVARGTQVVLSTHSVELIDRLLHHEAATKKMGPSVHRLRLLDGRLTATSLDRDKALRARDELLQDLRS